MIVRLTHTARRASVSEADKRVAFSIAPTSPSRNRSPSSSGFSPTTPPAPPIWKRHAGAKALPAPTAAVWANLSAPARRPDLPGLPPPDRLDRGHGDGAQSYAPQRLGGL